MNYNPKLHHRHSIRLRNYDYAQQGAYFITICTKNRNALFGRICNGKMELNEFGNIALYTLLDLPNHNTNVILDQFVIMPDHIHAIIIITGSKDLQNSNVNIKKHGLFEIIRQFKTFSARRINKLRNTPNKPVWHRTYHDHIIRNDKELNIIRKYIINNPLKWHHSNTV
jgi:REP element-mobilizing transposase RayT